MLGNYILYTDGSREKLTNCLMSVSRHRLTMDRLAPGVTVKSMYSVLVSVK